MPKITIERLGTMTQEKFRASRKYLDEHLAETEQRILRAIEGLEFKIAHYASGWNRDFDRLHGWVEELDKRLGALEGKPKK